MSSVRYKFIITLQYSTSLITRETGRTRVRCIILCAEAVEADGGILSQGGTQGFDHGQQQHQLTELADHYVWVEKSWLHCSLHAPYAYLCLNNLVYLYIYIYMYIFFTNSLKYVFLSTLENFKDWKKSRPKQSKKQNFQASDVPMWTQHYSAILLSRLALASSTPVSPSQRAQKDDR